MIESHSEGLALGDPAKPVCGGRDEAMVPAFSVHKLPALVVPPQAFRGSAAAGAIGPTVVQIGVFRA